MQSLGIRRWTAFGAGVGMEITPEGLQVAAVRVRPGGVTVLGVEALPGFTERPAAAWGADVAAFLKRHGLTGQPVTVILPTSEAVSRTLVIRGVTGKDLASAVEFQLDGIHPYGEGEAAVAWSALDRPGAALAGAARQETMERYVALFAEAGIAVGGFTTLPAAIHSALRFRQQPVGDFLAASVRGVESRLYGENATAPVFFAEMEMAPERATMLARAQMRMDAGETLDLDSLLPGASPAAAAALMSACPWLTTRLNLLPAERRAVRSRWTYAPTVVLAVIAIAAGLALAFFPRIAEHRLLTTLNDETAKWEPQASAAREAEQRKTALRARTDSLAAFRRRTKQDLDALMEATRLIAPPGFATRLDLTRGAITVAGEAAQAVELPKILDASPHFRNSEFVAPLNRVKDSPMDQFLVRAQRETPGR